MKLLSLIELFKYVVALAKEGKGLAAYTILLGFASAAGAWAGKEYVDTKHTEGLKAISKNQAKIEELSKNQAEIVTTLRVMQVTLSTMSDTVGDVKRVMNQTNESVQKTQEKVVEIYREVYEIKTKQPKT